MAQGPQSQISCLPVPQRPANHLPRIDIQHDRQVPPLPVNLDISEIRYPLLIYPGWGRHIKAQVLVALIESLHPRHPAVQLCHTPHQRSLPHQPLNTLTGQSGAFVTQGLMHSRAAIDAPAIPMDPAHFLQQASIFSGSWRLLAFAPRIVATPRHTQPIAQVPDA